MYFLEREEPYIKSVEAAGLSNSSCKMPLHTTRWKQIAVCEQREPLVEYAKRIKGKTRIISNEP